ncbi:hypothetical protein N7510_003673 [Penicillium lagena]|uniref:uncharacterized protein n=1 Tax=Penicillium lagena TaxID=94218 RepID=UPI0025415B63|nr:uncharacterized protein N7510_003673 [Penicillium lagena]KAJ5619689.1 hypothetical protein N7510_003673 [Penicillium lagena]
MSNNNNAFDPTYYYRFSNTALGPNTTLAVGLPSEPPKVPGLDPIRTFTSENWQIFFDQGVYFIRNWDYNATYQLGLTSERPVTPQLLATGPDFGMQWNLTMGESGWIMRNMLLGPVDMLGVDMSALSHTAPVMNTDLTGAEWSIDINTSAGRITDQAMLTVFSSLPVATIASHPKDEPSSSDSLSSGSIAGIVVGCIAGAAIVFVVVFFIIRRRRQHPQEHERIPDVMAKRHQLDGDGRRTNVLPGDPFYAEASAHLAATELSGKTVAELSGGDKIS